MGFFNMNYEKIYNQIVERGKTQKIITCPHCDKSGGISLMKRYHFDNCNSK